VADGLRRRGIDVTTTQDAALSGEDDPVHILFANSQRRVICTSDSDFLRLHGESIEHSGIAYYHQQERSVGELIRALELIWEVLEPDEMRNRVEFV
jgi:hypothetical protein